MGLLIFHSGDACRKLSRWLWLLHDGTLWSFHLGSSLRGFAEFGHQKKGRVSEHDSYIRKSLPKQGLLILSEKESNASKILGSQIISRSERLLIL